MSKLSIATFTNLGYRWHAREYEPLDVDLSGRTIVITGATGGLGLATARGLGRLGARVVLVARSAEKLAAAQEQVGSDSVTYQADLSLLTEVRAVANRLLDDLPQIHVLINNVGVLFPERRLTPEGLERTFATNLAGHFLLTNALSERLSDSAPSRIINVTSGGMYSEKIRPRDLQYERHEYKGASAYARTKRGQVILTELWAERLAERGVVVHSMHPGWAATDGVKTSLPTFNRIMKPFLRTPEQGADTIVWLAAADEPTQSTGRLWFDREVVPTHLIDRTVETPEDRQALWDELARITDSDMARF